MANLPEGVVIGWYNGVNFGYSGELLRYDVRPIADGSKRTVAYNLVSVTLRFLVGDANQATNPMTSIEVDMDAIRRRLTAYAGELHIEELGLGLKINIPAAGATVGTNSLARDVLWGPRPTLLSMVPYGSLQGALSAQVTWSVEVAIPICPAEDETRYTLSMMEFCYKWSVEIDRYGLSRRVHTGYVKVPATRSSAESRLLPDQADRLREEINPPLLPGFRRIPGRFSLDEAKTTLSFDIVDEEHPSANYPPPGVVDCKADHTVTSTTQGMIRWACTLNASYEMARDTPRQVAARHFLALLSDRMRQSEAARPGLERLAKRPAEKAAIAVSFTAAEPEIYGKLGARFACTYTLLSTAADLLQASGLWRPVPGSDWGKWAASLANTVHHVRGNAKLRFSTESDVLVDLCEPQGLNLRGGVSPPGKPLELVGRELKNLRPAERVSWLLYVCWVRVERLDELIEMKPLPVVPARTLGGGLAWSSGRERTLSTRPPDDGAHLSRVGPPPAASPVSPEAPILQKRAAPSYYAYLEGYALRAGHPVQVPELVSVGGAPAVPANLEGGGVTHGQLADWLGVGVFGAKWSKRYILTKEPAGIEVPDCVLREGN